MKISPSQISLFDPERGGCPRAWWYRYVGKLPQKKTKGKDFGDALHKELEGYLLGERGHETLSAHARAGLKYLPEPGDALHVELQNWQLVFDDIVLHGRIDLVDRPQLEVVDHKSTKDIEKYAKAAHELLDDPQCIIYLAYAYTAFGAPGDMGWTFRHIYYQSTTPASTTVAVEVSREENAEALAKLLQGPCAGIQLVSRIEKPNVVECNRDACMRYGGCDYASACPDAPGRRHTVDVFDFIKANTPAAPTPAAPTPAAPPSPAPTQQMTFGIMPPAAPPSPAPTQQMTFGIMPPDAPKAPAPTAPAPILDNPAVDPIPAPTPEKRKPGRPKKVAEPLPAVAAPPYAFGPPPSSPVAVPAAPAPAAPAQEQKEEPKAEPPPQGGFILCINCVPVDEPFTDLRAHVYGLAQTLADRASVKDIRLSDTYGYGKWKGAIAAAVRAAPPHIEGYGVLLTDDDFCAAAAIALSELAKNTIRGFAP